MLFQLTIAKNWGQEVNTILCVKKQCYWYQLLLIPVNWNKDSWHLTPAGRGSETSPPQFEHNEEHKCYPTHCWWGHQDRLYQHHRSHCSALWHCLADSFPLLCQEYQGMAEIEVRGRRRESRQSTSLSASTIIHCCNENVSGVQSFRKPKILTNIAIATLVYIAIATLVSEVVTPLVSVRKGWKCQQHTENLAVMRCHISISFLCFPGRTLLYFFQTRTSSQ